MNHLAFHSRHLTAFAGCLALAVSAAAQTTAATDQSAPTEAIMLDEFTVRTDQASGYRATNAITATGIGSKISDTPLAISVVTHELIADTSLFEAREALNLVPGVLT
ncbi:MAG: hypothetical protein ABIV50_11285, partial [Opitutus sp.]